MDALAMNLSCGCPQPSPLITLPTANALPQLNSQTAILDAFFPGFSVLSSALYKYSSIDVTLYIPLLLVLGAFIYASQYIQSQVWDLIEAYFTSSADIRIDDEMYNMVMAWIANQDFAKQSRRFVANTNLNSRSWSLWRFEDEADEENVNNEVGVEFDADGNAIATGKGGQKEKKLRFTPSFGRHYFWYKNRLLMFRRTQDVRQNSCGAASEREEISLYCLGRNPAILKDLLDECRKSFLNMDETRTVIYRGGVKPGTTEPTWTRCISRVSRPFSTVVLDDKVKEKLLEDMRRYLHPHSVRWYSNRGIPYRRGYLLHGPPGTGKSSLSFAVAGYFKLKIYIVSLNSQSMDEEKLGTLFAELPKQCVVLLEDIDTAGLTHTRRDDSDSSRADNHDSKSKDNKEEKGKISLSALLNIIDGVASAEGRILIMTTNHIEKLDPALIRPGRVDMKIKFGLANEEMLKTIFRSIFAVMEGDLPSDKVDGVTIRSAIGSVETHISNGHGTSLLLGNDRAVQEKENKRLEEEMLQMRKKEDEKVNKLADDFAARIPEMTFSPAEIQGFLLRHKMDPEGAVSGAESWMEEMKVEREKQEEKQAKEAKEELEKVEKKTAEKAEKEKTEKEKAEKEKAEKKRSSTNTEDSDSDSDTSNSKTDSKRRKRKQERKKNKARARRRIEDESGDQSDD